MLLTIIAKFSILDVYRGRINTFDYFKLFQKA